VAVCAGVAVGESGDHPDTCRPQEPWLPPTRHLDARPSRHLLGGLHVKIPLRSSVAAGLTAPRRGRLRHNAALPDDEDVTRAGRQHSQVCHKEDRHKDESMSGISITDRCGSCCRLNGGSTSRDCV
jgi:hypothetical protein